MKGYLILKTRKKITEVFTPRQSEVNDSMYVSRSTLEKDLLRSLERNSHTLIFGESGNGKSWLYKKVLKENSIPYVVSNCANADRFQSITQEICNSIIEPGTVKKLGFKEDKVAELKALLAKAGVKHSGEYEIHQDEPLLYAFKIFSEINKNKKIIVLDNLEAIFQSKQLMKELSNIIILLDDERYSRTNINFLIVGTPNGVLDYFEKTENAQSISNRIQELEKISSLNKEQVEKIIAMGFHQLKVLIPKAQNRFLSKHVWEITLGIAQRVHEYCEELAYAIKDNNWDYDYNLLKIADHKWLLNGLRSSYKIVEHHFNTRKTSRTNQVIYCIAMKNSHQFNALDIENLIRKEFNKTVQKNMPINQILNNLAKGKNPLLIKNKQSNTFSIKEPRYLMCIKVVLLKDLETQDIKKRNFTK